MDNQTVSAEEKQRVRALCEEYLKALGAPELIPQLTIEWNSRFTSRMGDASYTPTLAKYGEVFSPATVRFSSVLWGRVDRQHNDNTVAHEICHIVDQYRTYDRMMSTSRRYSKYKPHGASWKALMLSLGANPRRCHQAKNDDLVKKSKRISAYCACQEHMITKNRAGRMKKGAQYRCKVCKTLLSFVPYGNK